MKILLVEENPDDVRIITEMLRRAPSGPFDLNHVAGLEQALTALREQTYDVLLLDLDLPDSQGLENLPIAQEQTGNRLPTIVLTNSDDETVAIEAVRRGAQDFLHKRNMTSEVLRRSLRYAVERHRAQRASLESQAQHRQLTETSLIQSTALSAAANGIMITDRAGTILWVNPAFTALTGFTAEEVIGQNPRLLKSGQHDEAFYSAFWSTISSGGIWRGEFINRRKDGSLCMNEQTVAPVRSGGQEITHFICVMQDITERKALADALHQAQRLEAFGQLAAGVAHDFNNLLTIIRGSAELVLMAGTGLSVEANEELNHVIGAAERGAALTRQLLIFGRKQVLQPQPVTLTQLIGNLAGMLNRIIREDIRLECRCAEQLPFVQADPGMLEQVLINLVVNARDAMPHGGHMLIMTEKVTLDESCVQTNPEARPGEYVCLTVSDTGSGIAPEELPRIFEPFFTTKAPGKGTGLGLATVYGTVKQHQGWIEVSSRPGQGSAFRIFLPAIPPPVRLEMTEPAEGQFPGGTETILLVEDDLSVRIVTRRVLEKFHYRVLEATSARDAMVLWSRHSEEIALLLTDIVLPDGISGRDLARRVHAQTPGLRIIFFSGYSAAVLGKDTEFMQQTRSYFLAKPCSPSNLLQTVRRCLDQQ